MTNKLKLVAGKLYKSQKNFYTYLGVVRDKPWDKQIVPIQGDLRPCHPLRSVGISPGDILLYLENFRIPITSANNYRAGWYFETYRFIHKDNVVDLVTGDNVVDLVTGEYIQDFIEPLRPLP